MEVFDPIANRWEKCHPMTTARSRVGVAVVNGLLYAIGGYDGQLRLSTVEAYNPETDTWTRVGSMNSKRRYSGSQVQAEHTLSIWGAPCRAHNKVKFKSQPGEILLPGQPLPAPPGSKPPSA